MLPLEGLGGTKWCKRRRKKFCNHPDPNEHITFIVTDETDESVTAIQGRPWAKEATSQPFLWGTLQPWRRRGEAKRQERRPGVCSSSAASTTSVQILMGCRANSNRLIFYLRQASFPISLQSLENLLEILHLHSIALQRSLVCIFQANFHGMLLISIWNP